MTAGEVSTHSMAKVANTGLFEGLGSTRWATRFLKAEFPVVM